MTKGLIHATVVAIAVGIAMLCNDAWNQPILGWALAGGIQAVSAQLVFVPREKQSATRLTVAAVVAAAGCSLIALAVQKSWLS